MREIRLSNTNRMALVDDEDFDRVNQFHLYTWYFNNGYVRTTITVEHKRQTFGMHNLIMQAKHIDHIDGNPLNNCRANLRIATSSQNSINRRKRITTQSTSQYKGVSWNKKRNRWQVAIMCKRQNYFIGCFQDEIEAAKAYNVKALELFGEFAKLNDV